MFSHISGSIGYSRVSMMPSASPFPPVCIYMDTHFLRLGGQQLGLKQPHETVNGGRGVLEIRIFDHF